MIMTMALIMSTNVHAATHSHRTTIGAIPQDSRPPKLFVFYHVPKTGGSTVREWILRNAGMRARGLPTRLRGLVRYYEAKCFVCLQFSGLLGDACTADERAKCLQAPPRRGTNGFFDSVRGTWHTLGLPLAVEFHGPTAETFVRDVLPRVRALRQLYAKLNGSVVLTAVVREPVDLLFSSYHMWPPRPSADRVTPFPEWVRGGVAGLQGAHFITPSCAPVERARGQMNKCACDSRRARHALRAFDVVGVTACLGGFFDGVEDALELTPPDGPYEKALRRASRGNVSAGLLRAKPSCTDCTPAESTSHGRWTWENLSVADRHATLEVARCDGALFEAAAARARKQGARQGGGGKGGGGVELRGSGESSRADDCVLEKRWLVEAA